MTRGPLLRLEREFSENTRLKLSESHFEVGGQPNHFKVTMWSDYDRKIKVVDDFTNVYDGGFDGLLRRFVRLSSVTELRLLTPRP